MLLANKLNLITSITSITRRNTLINQLNSCMDSDPVKIYKYALAFILGSSLNISKEEKLRESNELKALYNCFLCMEKFAALLKNDNPLNSLIIIKAQGKLLLHFNQNYRLLLENPKRLMKHWKNVINNLGTSHKPSQDQLSKIKGTILEELKLPSLKPMLIKTTRLVLPDAQDTISFLDRVKVFINKCISSSFKIPRIFPQIIYNMWHYQQVFIKSSQGHILDGLCVQKGRNPTKTIILVLIAASLPEDFYVFYNTHNYHTLFDNDVVFIKYRNQALRSNQYSLNTMEWAQDIVSFVDYYKKQNYCVGLYGYCGGAAPMIMAARMLHERGEPINLVVDRFATSYTDFFQKRTVLRTIKLQNIAQSVLLKPAIDDTPNALKISRPSVLLNILISNALMLPLLFILMIIAKPVLWLARETENYGEILRSLPGNQVLTLQAKGKMTTDFSVPESYSIRNANKTKRKEQKELLNLLTHQCFKLQRKLADCVLLNVFENWNNFFDKCLQLISNEKLNALEESNVVTDLHLAPLPYLTTRNKMPIKDFIGGFFNAKNIRKNFDVLDAFDVELINTVLQSQNAVYPDTETIAEAMALILNLITTNKDYLCAMANRVTASFGTDISFSIECFIGSSLYKDFLAFSLERSVIRRG